MQKFPSSYVIQGPDLYPFFLNESDQVPSPYTANMPDGLSCQELTKLLKRCLIGFSSVEPWLDHSRSHDLSFGMRIHGNMNPLQSAIPAVLIAHDTRTEGLGSVMKIPMLGVDEFIGTEINDLPELMLKRFVDCLPEYEDARIRLKGIMQNYLADHNLA